MSQQSPSDWSSTLVVLSLLSLGAIGTVASCQPDKSLHDPVETVEKRNLYQSKEACVADYSEEACESYQTGGGSGSGGVFFYRGPSYPAAWQSAGQNFDPARSGPGRAALASPDGVVAHPTQTTRGGFGSTGRSYSSRGG
ncbi:MAG: hypothetical protein RL145_1808 [Pseudomonadota bacterium]|jgi:hypothetical protein